MLLLTGLLLFRNGLHQCWVRTKLRGVGVSQWTPSLKHPVKGRLEAWNLTTKLELLKASHEKNPTDPRASGTAHVRTSSLRPSFGTNASSRP